MAKQIKTKTAQQKISETKQLLAAAATLKGDGVKVSDAQLLKAVAVKLG